MNAPKCIPWYNFAMQAVDRFDQLMQLFSLVKRHHCKKWYKQFKLILWDMGNVQADIHFHEQHPDKKKIKLLIAIYKHTWSRLNQYKLVSILFERYFWKRNIFTYHSLQVLGISSDSSNNSDSVSSAPSYSNDLHVSLVKWLNPLRVWVLENNSSFVKYVCSKAEVENGTMWHSAKIIV